jgi:L-malate glycosyltransferase
VPDTVRIFNEVKKEIPSRLLLVGDGPDRSYTEKLCRELGICNDVIFLGKQAELVEIYSSADIFLMPSQSESFGLSALEAMACGLPVISSSVGGLPELQVHGATGFIAEMGDIDRMARYTIDLLRDENKYAIFSEAARARAVNMFDSEKIIPQYEQHYEKVLAAARP